jgi:hypothetical protein
MKFSIHVQGDSKLWSFDFEGDPRYWDEWLADGLEMYEKLGETEIGKGVSDWIRELDEYNQGQVKDYLEKGDEDDDNVF